MHEYVARLRQDDRRSDWPFPLMAEQLSCYRLTWWPQLGIGYHPIRPGIESKIYNQDYFDKFARNADTFIGQALMQARVAFVEEHYQGPLIDIGIGSGAFIELRKGLRSTYGYDINPRGIEWLKERDLFIDPYAEPFDAASMWDVIEHIPNFASLLVNIHKWLFLSLPIFDGPEHVLESKHFKPDEHCWYFTRDGLVWTMKCEGFELVSESSVETELGREDIGTFAFRNRYFA